MHHMEGHLSRPVMCQPLLRTVFRIHQIGMIARLIHHRLNAHEVRYNFVLPRVDEVVDTHDHPLRNRVDCLLQLPEQPQITAAEKQCVHLERAAEQHLQIMQEAVLLFCTKRIQIADLRGGNRLTECADELHQRLTALVLDLSDSIHLQRTIQRRPLRLRQLLPHMLVEALQKTAVQLR